MMRAVSIPLFLVIVSLITAGCSHRTSTVRDEPHYVTEKSLTQETGNRTEENRAETSSWSVITDPVVKMFGSV